MRATATATLQESDEQQHPHASIKIHTSRDAGRCGDLIVRVSEFCILHTCGKA